LDFVQKQFRSSAAQENSVSAILAMLLMHSMEQSPLGMGVVWERATPAKVAARTEKDFILTVGVLERAEEEDVQVEAGLRYQGTEVEKASEVGLVVRLLS